MKKMKKHLSKSSIILIILIIFILIWFVGIPKYKFQKKYDVPHDCTPEETIELFFEYVDSHNPKQANLLFINPRYTAFSFNNIVSASVNSIDCTGVPSNYTYYDSYYECKEFLVNYECKYFPFGNEHVFWGPSGSIFFVLVKETSDSDWKILETYTGP